MGWVGGGCRVRSCFAHPVRRKWSRVAVLNFRCILGIVPLWARPRLGFLSMPGQRSSRILSGSTQVVGLRFNLPFLLLICNFIPSLTGLNHCAVTAMSTRWAVAEWKHFETKNWGSRFPLPGQESSTVKNFNGRKCFFFTTLHGILLDFRDGIMHIIQKPQIYTALVYWPLG